ncbi:AmmeMemoRadiSam system protein B [Patescibacteria group bacterium]|nr:AmmeMemoRadiSam system protein B [Patescibacteria group bacterium]MBU4512144.1 AmmeMemoRadiSam system protein B [Patescibacteria group bacterium]MCG2693220.1 AmmeMemoRadiSam system protein B [Candidatus Parcubacteria bacterium]
MPNQNINKETTEKKSGLTRRSSSEAKSEGGPIRKPAVAGAFYPADKNELQEMVNDFLSRALMDANQYTNSANHESTDDVNKAKPKILIVPHAGLVYSGQVAAYSYKAVQSLDYKTVILIGPSHTAYFDGVSVYPKGFYETPLGQVQINDLLAGQLIKSDEKISYYPQAHITEHNLEVQLPFLQTVLPNAKIVPIIMGKPDANLVKILALALQKIIGDETLLVISSDLSHYPEYETAKEVDQKTIEAILTQNIDEFEKVISQSIAQDYPGLDTCACGAGPLKVGMMLAGDWNLDGELLKYANSGDVTDDHSRVVGYASIVFKGGGEGLRRLEKAEEGEGVNTEDRARLLEIARETLEEYLENGKIPKIEVESEKLNENLGAFVTLRNKKRDYELRGCIGRFSPTDEALYKIVQQMAISAATQDTRFASVTYDELDDIEIEISVLSQLKKIDDWQKIEVGKHGVEVVQGMRKGVFLPQVATENNWDLETFMNELCEHKAGIDRDAWKTGEAELYIFTAEVFGENEFVDG